MTVGDPMVFSAALTAEQLATLGPRGRRVEVVNFDDPAGQALARAAAVEALQLPAVVTATGVIRNATAAVVSGHLGLTFALTAATTTTSP